MSALQPYQESIRPTLAAPGNYLHHGAKPPEDVQSGPVQRSQRSSHLRGHRVEDAGRRPDPDQSPSNWRLPFRRPGSSWSDEHIVISRQHR